MRLATSLHRSTFGPIRHRVVGLAAAALLGIAVAASVVLSDLGRATAIEAAAPVVPTAVLDDHRVPAAGREPAPGARVPRAATGHAVSIVSAPVEWIDSNGDGIHDAWAYDDNGDGAIDRIVCDRNQDGWLDVAADAGAGRITAMTVDSNFDGYYDALVVPNVAYGAQASVSIYRDLDQDARYEDGFFDGQLDGIFEWIMIDADGDGSADTWVANASPAGHTAADEAARQVAAVGAFQILQAGGVPIFGPLAWPVGG